MRTNSTPPNLLIHLLLSACQTLSVCSQRSCSTIEFNGLDLGSASDAFESVGQSLQILKLSDNALGT